MHPMKTKVYSFRAKGGYIREGVNTRKALDEKLAWAVIKGLLLGLVVYWSGQKVYKRLQNMEIVDNGKQE